MEQNQVKRHNLSGKAKSTATAKSNAPKPKASAQNNNIKHSAGAGQEAKNNSNSSPKNMSTKTEQDTSNSQKIKPASMQESEANNAEKLEDSKNPKQKQPATHFWWLDAIYFILGTAALGGIATLLGGKMFDFGGFKLPPATAPAWFFGVAWAIIYLAIGVATFCMWRDKQITSGDRKFNLILYFIHMAFNITWPLFFFRLAMPIVSCVWLAIILILALITTWRYFVANLASGIIFCIYVMWLIYAFYLNIGICMLLP